MFTERQHREIAFLINQLSADMLVEQGLIVEAIKDDAIIRESLLEWLNGSLTYGKMLDLVSEVF